MISTQDFLDTVAGYTRAKTDGSADKPVRLAVVDPAYSAGLPKVTFEGESTMSAKGYAFIESYVPVAGQRVAMVPVGTTYLIVGAVDSGTGNIASRVGIPHSVNLNGANAGATTTSATYVDMTGVAVTIVKKRADTVLRVGGCFDSYVTVASTETRFAVRVNAVDYDLKNLFFNPASQHLPSGGAEVIIPGLAAGSYTVQGRWRRVSGTGVLTRNGNDWYSLTAIEEWA